jgi:hypothetical protein
VALLLCVLALPVLIAATYPAHAVDRPVRPAATASVAPSQPPERATTLPGAEKGTSWYNTDAVLELTATVLVLGGASLLLLRRAA